MVFFVNANRSGAPIYEVPEEMYSGEAILDMLFNTDKDRICKGRPMKINTSATFVIDIDSLRHPDDVRKDRWIYSGSHVLAYRSWKTSKNVFKFEKVTDYGKNDKSIFQLRRIHCKHPSNQQFQRLLAFVTGMSSLL